MKLLALTAPMLLLANAAAAQCGAKGCSVPEIDAMAGIAAIAVVGGALALIRERAKR